MDFKLFGKTILVAMETDCFWPKSTQDVSLDTFWLCEREKLLVRWFQDWPFTPFALFPWNGQQWNLIHEHLGLARKRLLALGLAGSAWGVNLFFSQVTHIKGALRLREVANEENKEATRTQQLG